MHGGLGNEVPKLGWLLIWSTEEAARKLIGVALNQAMCSHSIAKGHVHPLVRTHALRVQLAFQRPHSPRSDVPHWFDLERDRRLTRPSETHFDCHLLRVFYVSDGQSLLPTVPDRNRRAVVVSQFRGVEGEPL